METYIRTPNTACAICSKPIYRRPCELKKRKGVYCSTECYGKSQLKLMPCVICGTPIKSGKNAKTCSRTCSNKNREGLHYNKGGEKLQNASQRRLKELQDAFEFTTCMVIGCGYSKTFDIHRLIPGKLGGEYEVGNMFAVCPNHHAENHRGIVKLTKVNDFTLKAEYGELAEPVLSHQS